MDGSMKPFGGEIEAPAMVEVPCVELSYVRDGVWLTESAEIAHAWLPRSGIMGLPKPPP